MVDSKIKKYLADQARLEKYLEDARGPEAIGTFYERYIGYLYEIDGYRVEYLGIKKGLEDMGRDLIARKGNELLVIQCKKWSKSVLIHAKHIHQLFGTSIHLQKEYKSQVRPIFATTTELSDEAQRAAEDLEVEVRLIPFNKDYPMVKCNINARGRLYHLPFGKWYDSVQITPKSGDYFVHRVEQAVELGFSSAYLYKKAA